jgi:hypothetical protein
MTFDQRKKVRFQENERLDLPDALAMADLRDTDMYSLMRAVISEPGPASGPDFRTRGCVFRGFAFTVETGNVRIENVAGVAMDTSGNLLLRDSGVQIDISLALSSPNYIYAYYVESATDADARKSLDPTSKLESSVNTETRTTRGVSFFRSTSDQLTATVGGLLRPLVPICYVSTDAGGVSTNGANGEDRRPLFLHTSVVASPGSESALMRQEEANLINGVVTTGSGEDSNVHPVLAAPYPLVTAQSWIRRIAEQLANATGKKWWQKVTRNLETANAEIVHARGGGAFASSDTGLGQRISAEHGPNGQHTNVTTDHIVCGSIRVTGANYGGVDPAVYVTVGQLRVAGYIHTDNDLSAGPANQAVISAAGAYTGTSASISGLVSAGSLNAGYTHVVGNNMLVDGEMNSNTVLTSYVHSTGNGNVDGVLSTNILRANMVQAGNGYGNGAGHSFFSEPGFDTGMYSAADGSMYFRCNNVNLMRLEASYGVPYVNGIAAVGDAFGNNPTSNMQLCTRNWRNNVVGFGWTLAAGSTMLSAYNVAFLSHGSGSGVYNVRSRTTISAESSNTVSVWDRNGQAAVIVYPNISGGYWSFEVRNGAGTLCEAGFNFASVGMPNDFSGIPGI